MKARRVHPCPPAAASAVGDQLALLPSAVMALAAALTAEDQEVLAHLLSGGSYSGGPKNGGTTSNGRRRGRRGTAERRRPHAPELGCSCFSCYKSFWVRWDASPNRQLIHHILDAFEETLEAEERAHAMKRMRRRRRRSGRDGRRAEEEEEEEEEAVKGLMALDGGDVAHNDDDDGGGDDDDDDDDDDADDDDGDEDGEKSSVRRFMSFIGERMWGVWNKE